MPRERRRRRPEPTPVEQLNTWRDWRHDTAEFPVVGDVPEGDSWAATEELAEPRRRTGAGVLIATALVLVAVVLGGLTAVGVGPISRLLRADGAGGGGGGGGAAAPTTSASAGPTPSAVSSTGSASADSASPGTTTADSSAAPAGTPRPGGTARPGRRPPPGARPPAGP